MTSSCEKVSRSHHDSPQKHSTDKSDKHPGDKSKINQSQHYFILIVKHLTAALQPGAMVEISQTTVETKTQGEDNIATLTKKSLTHKTASGGFGADNQSEMDADNTEKDSGVTKCTQIQSSDTEQVSLQQQPKDNQEKRIEKGTLSTHQNKILAQKV